jgi:hypothetical protein
MSKLIQLLFVTLFFAVSAQAECVKDNFGAVFCAKEPAGGAVTDSMGSAQCGAGQCKVDNTGTIFCSKVAGGGAAADAINMIYCTGGCERASSARCVRGQH